MNRFYGLLVRRVGEAKYALGIMIKPVGDELDVMLPLCVQVQLVGCGHVRSRSARSFVAVHVEWH
jgi:hypothetical protein